MADSDQSRVLSDLARAKALFQMRTIAALMREGAERSKPDQETRADGKEG